MGYPDMHPRFGKPLSGAPLTINGVTFRPYRFGVGRAIRVSDDFRITVYGSYNLTHYTASVDGGSLPTKFRKQRNAYLAAIKQLHTLDANKES